MNSIWQQALELHQTMEAEGKGIFVELHGEKFFLRDVIVDEEDFSLLKDGEAQYGMLRDEVICDVYALVGTEDEDEKKLLLSLATNPEAYIPFRYVEMEDPRNSDDESIFIAIKDRDPLPTTATGRFLRFNPEICEFYFVQ
jgi:hypothetical protein